MTAVPLGPAYARLWSATALANLGDGIRSAAFPLLAAALTTSPTLVAGVAVASMAPALVLGLPAGVVADRVDRRRLLATVDVVRTVLLLGLVLAVTLGQANLAVVYVVAFSCGAAEVLRDTAASTMVPAVVPSEQVDRANGRLVTAEIAGNEFVGPPLGGYLFGVAMALPFAVNGGALALAVALIASLPGVFRPGAVPDVGEAVSGGVREALRFVRERRELLVIPATSVALAMTDTAWFTLLVLYVRDVLGLPPVWFGVLLAVGALGGIGGGLVAARLGRAVGLRVTIVGSLLVAAFGQLALGLTGHVVVTAVVLATSSLVFAVWNVAARTLVHRRTPGELLGRVSAINRTVVTAASILGALLGGIGAEQLSLRAPFLLGAPLLLIAALIGWLGLGGPATSGRRR